MGRESYDDMTEITTGSGKNGSTKLLIVTIFLALLVCFVSILIWMSVTKETENAETDTVQAVTEENKIPATEVVTLVINNPDDDIVADGSIAGNVDSSTEPPETVESEVASSLDDVKIENDKAVKFDQYTMKEGDSLLSIADFSGLRAQTLVSVNEIKNPDMLKTGMSILIPDRDGSIYVVKDGDVLSSVVKKLNLEINWKELQDLNGISGESPLVSGQKIFIPDEKSSPEVAETSLLINPLSAGEVTGLYNQTVKNGSGEKMILDGILLKVSEKTPVSAAADGIVVQKGVSTDGRGKYLMLTHSDGYTSYYLGLTDIDVDQSDKIYQGQTIGDTDSTLFFRIEKDGIALNPVDFFPSGVIEQKN